uniref:Transposase n=1 Tax=Panagrellus redivivus TaxID=6233 RepID=A0A7E4V2F5_PANRE
MATLKHGLGIGMELAEYSFAPLKKNFKNRKGFKIDPSVVSTWGDDVWMGWMVVVNTPAAVAHHRIEANLSHRQKRGWMGKEKGNGQKMAIIFIGKGLSFFDGSSFFPRKTKTMTMYTVTVAIDSFRSRAAGHRLGLAAPRGSSATTSKKTRDGSGRPSEKLVPFRMCWQIDGHTTSKQASSMRAKPVSQRPLLRHSPRRRRRTDHDDEDPLFFTRFSRPFGPASAFNESRLTGGTRADDWCQHGLNPSKNEP